MEDKIAVLVKLGKIQFNKKDNVFEYIPNESSLFNIHSKEKYWNTSISELAEGAYSALLTADGKEALEKTAK